LVEQKCNKLTTFWANVKLPRVSTKDIKEKMSALVTHPLMLVIMYWTFLIKSCLKSVLFVKNWVIRVINFFGSLVTRFFNLFYVKRSTIMVLPVLIIKVFMFIIFIRKL
jgi:hypothetical protein